MKKKTELQVGDIWGVLPLEKTLEMRIIYNISFGRVYYTNIGSETGMTDEPFFRSWITRKKAKKIGHYDFKTGKCPESLFSKRT